MNSFAWAIIGPGNIAYRFAEAVQGTPGAHLGLVAGRDAARASEFAARWQRPERPPISGTGLIHDVLADPTIQAVYIATPHTEHADYVRQCLLAGKAVLCEKPLVPSAKIARELIEISRSRRVFLMEAVWTRFLPIYEIVARWLRDDRIGELRSMQSSFCFDVTFDADTAKSRLYNPTLAGGTLLDIGVYNITMSRWAIQQANKASPTARKITASGVLAPSGVDQRVCGQIDFDGGVTSQFVCAFNGTADNAFRLYGQRGYIEIESRFWEAATATLHRTNEARVVETRPFAINGFEYELQAAMQAIKRGDIECAEISHDETLATLESIDEMREQLGVRYPFESSSPRN